MHIPTTILKTLSTNQRKGLEARLTGDLRVKDGDTQTAQLVMDIMRESRYAWCSNHSAWHRYDPYTWIYNDPQFRLCPPPPRTATEWHEPTAPTAEGPPDAKADTPGGASAPDTATAEQRIEKHMAGKGESKNSVEVLKAKEALRKDGTLPVDMEQPDLDESMAQGDLSKSNPDKPNCGVTHGQYTCTLPKNHTGDHIAHWSDGKKAQRWQQQQQTEPMARSPQKQCGHRGTVFQCTRPLGHEGDHVGHVEPDGREVGRWPQDERMASEGEEYCNVNGGPKHHRCTRPKGHTGDHVGHSESSGKFLSRWPQEGPPPPVKKWKKKLFNRCPQCSMDTLNTELQSPPEPVDETERIEYTERPCGCEVLKDIGIA